MRGLLDWASTPEGIGLLSAAFGGLAGARPGQPLNSLGRAGLAGITGFSNALDARAAQKDREQKMRFQQLQEDRAAQLFPLQLAQVTAQTDETKAQAAQRLALAEEAARKQREAEAVRRLLVNQLTPTQPIEANAVSGITGPRPEALAAVGAQRKIDPQALVAQGVPVETVKALMESPNYGRVEVSRTVQGKDAQGRPVTFQFDKFGQQVGQPIEDWKDQQTVDFGGQIYLRDPITNRLSKLGDKTQTPDSQASNRLGWANYGLAKDRLTFDQTQPKNQYDAERGVLVDPRTGVAVPVMQGGQPLGAKQKDLTDAQSKALLFGTRALEADTILAGLAKDGVDRPGTIKSILETAPLIGGGLGAIANVAPTWAGGPSAPQQQVEQAQRDFINAVLRRESGALISPDEFDNARKQYFPQVGDSEAVKAQKKRNRETAVQGILQEVPDSRRPTARAADPQTPTPTKRWNPSTNKFEPVGG